MVYQISDKVSWIGKIDWQLRKFHGDQLTTRLGSSYNAYLIKDEKNVVVDSVYRPFAAEWIEELKKEIDLDKIDYIVANHGEPDHSGGLPALLELIPDVPVICTANGAKTLKGHYHKDWNFQVVKSGDTLKIGSAELTFIEAPMLHWPDTMMTYMSGEEILFSNDIFGQHIASEKMWADGINEHELYEEAMIYYANIVAPFSSKCLKKVQEFKAMNLPVKFICPAHGMMWRDNPSQIIDTYEKWADSYQENQITLIYDSMYGNTRRMAEYIAEGLREADKEVTIKLLNASSTPSSDIITEAFRSKGFLIGSSTVNNGILNSVAGVIEEIKGMKFSGKKGAAFGSYGWAPGSVKIINQILEDGGIEVVGKGLKVQWNPDESARESCIELGKEFAEAFKA